MSSFRKRLMMQALKPYDAEVEYIETDGNAYINTGVNVSSSITFDLQLYFPIQESNRWVVGANDGTYKYRLLRAPTDNIWRFDFGTKNIVGLFWDHDVSKTHRFYTTESGKFIIDKSTLNLPAETFNITVPFYIFTINNNGTNLTPFLGARLFYAQLYSSGVLVRDYIPVRKNGIGYLFDKVTETLYGNANSIGAFIIGNDK